MSGRKEAYQSHRTNLFAQLPNNSIAIIANPPTKIRNNDVEYEYRSDSHFQYLTDFPEPETVAVFIKTDNIQKYCLFCLPKDPEKETWTGERIGAAAAKQSYGADEAYDLAQLPQQIAVWLKNAKPTLWMLHEEVEGKRQPVEIHARLTKICAEAKHQLPKAAQIHDLTPALERLRDTKDAYELDQMREAAKVSMQGHVRAWQTLATCSEPHETRLQAQLMRTFLLHGNNHGLAYPCIVAGGNRANTLHYEANDKALTAGELVLIDAAAETKEGYASDITRTVPVNGHFTLAQAEVYQRVLDIQKVLIDMCVPGANFYDIQRKMVTMATQALLDFKILQGDLDALVESKAYRKYLPHGFGHWIGLDVHDPIPYRHDPAEKSLTLKVQPTWLSSLIVYVRQGVAWLHAALRRLLRLPVGAAAKDKLSEKTLGRALKENHVLTVEPGLYLPLNDTAIPEQYRGIGIRIEDVVLVRREGGPEILTAALPKEIRDIEEAMKLPADNSLSEQRHGGRRV